MRPGEFWEALNAYNEEVIAQRKHLGELIRGATLRLWNTQVSKGHRIDDVKKFWRMPWDEDQEVNEMKRLQSLSESERNEEVQKFLSKINGKVK